MSQFVAQKNLFGVVGATVTMVGDGVGLAVVGAREGAVEGGSVCACTAVGASVLFPPVSPPVSPPVVHWYGRTLKHASVALLQVAQVFVGS